MKIIKSPKPDIRKWKQQVSCHSCHADLEIDAWDIVSREGSYVSMCPLCGETISKIDITSYLIEFVDKRTKKIEMQVNEKITKLAKKSFSKLERLSIFAKYVGTYLDKRDQRTELLFDGASIAAKGPISDTAYELAHWVLTPKHRLKYKNFGLGDLLGTGKKVPQVVSDNLFERQCQHASVLSILILRHVGFNWRKDFIDHGWASVGPNGTELIQIISKLMTDGLLSDSLAFIWPAERRTVTTEEVQKSLSILFNTSQEEIFEDNGAEENS